MFSHADINMKYLTTMNYYDIVQLCKSNKQLLPVCKNDELFKNIVYSKTGIIVNKKYNIAKILATFDRNIDDMFVKYFPIKNLPPFVIPEIFYEYQKKIFYKEFFVWLLIKLDEDEDDTNKLYIFSSQLSYPMCSDNVDYSSIHEKIGQYDPMIVQLPKDMMGYIKDNTQDKYKYGDYLNRVKILLFL